MSSLDEAITEALNRALRDDFAGAKELLADRDDRLAIRLVALFDRLIERRSTMKTARHEMGNALSIAQASLEGMMDGIVHITEPRLQRLRQILDQVGDSMYALTFEASPELKQDQLRSDDRLGAVIADVLPLFEVKGAHFEYAASDAANLPSVANDAVLNVVRNALLLTARYVSESDRLTLATDERRRLTLTVESLRAAHIRDAIGAVGHVLREDDRSFQIALTPGVG